MNITEILNQQRELYLTDLFNFYQKKTNGTKELMIELNNNEPVREFRLYRFDYCEEIDGKSITIDVNSDKYLDFDTIKYTCGDLKIEINPFYWNGCEFILQSNSIENDWLIKWTKKWIDEAGEKEEDENGVTGVIHNVMKPEITKDGDFLFSVDFGSANIESFLELINEIYLQDIKLLRIGSFSMINKKS